MHIFKTKPNFDFVGKRYIALAISAFLLVAGIGAIIFKGFQYGVDFRGGYIIQIQFIKQKPPIKKIRTLFKKNLTKSVSITTFGDQTENEILISLSQAAVAKGTDVREKIEQIFKGQIHNYKIRRFESVGPKVGADLKKKAYQAVIASLIVILAYIWFRFQLRYGLGAVVALFHDVLIILGIFSFMGKEITLTIVAALLTVVGYSLNDTIVVFDRVRENVFKLPNKNLDEVINTSVNESLSRTILTSVTTFFVVVFLFALGGDIIHDFSFAVLIGLVVGTYSSVFVASPMVLFLDAREKKSGKVKPQKKEEKKVTKDKIVV
ncbi:MAG: preprotein translocase subunit SecF [bacterium]|jgi:preprotein translocase subunit SecF